MEQQLTLGEILPIGPDDLPRVRALAYEIWPEAYAGVLPADRIPGMLADIYSLDTLASDIFERGHVYWIARLEGEDVGFASAYLKDDRVWIKKLYMLQRCRGLGMGKRLIATAVAQFPGAASVGLLVNDGNANSIAFYRSQGFDVEDRVPVRMGPYDFTDFLMAKRL